MKKFIVVFLFSFFCCTSYVYAETGMHWFIGLTGGTTTSLDRYDSAGTDAYEDGNVAIGVDNSGNFYSFQYDADLVQTEESPDYIVPDDNSSGTGCWVKQTSSSVTIGSCIDGSCTADELFADIIGLVNLDFSSTASVFGKFIFSDSNISPSATGQLVYDNNVEGIDDGCFAWWDDDAPRYFIDSPTLPTLNNQSVLYNSITDQWEPGFPIIHKSWNFDPDEICDGAADRLFLMTVDDNAVMVDKWKLSFEANPATEADIDLKRADAFIGVASSAVMDVLDTTAGVSSESTSANINGGVSVANGKVMYLEFGTAYTETTHQIIFEMWYHHLVSTAGAGATLIFDDGTGFESPWTPVSNSGNWDSFSGTPTSEGTVVAKGSVSMSTNAAEYMVETLSSAQTEVWSDFWIRLAANAQSVDQIWKLNATGGASWIYASVISSTEELRITDGTNTYNTGILLPTGSWVHVFLHISLTTGGSEIIQVAVNAADTWDTWDYTTSAATIIPNDLLTFNFGRCTATATVVYYFDACRVYGGADMPADW
jgi:hypothetical protein